MLAGESHRAARPLLLRDPAHLMVECVIEPDMLVDRNGQTALCRKIGIAHGVLRAAGCWHAELCGPPRPCTSCRRRAKQAHRGWCLGLDHGVGHSLLLLCHAKAPNY